MKAPLLPLLAASAIWCATACAQEKQPQAEALGAAWDHFNNARYDEGLASIEQSLATLHEKADAEAKAALGFAAAERAHDAGAMNTAGTLLLIKGRLLEKQGGMAAALNAYDACVARFPFAQAWDPGGWFWKPAADAKERALRLRLTEAVAARTLESAIFPEKEDALDIPAQRRAATLLAAEWLAAERFDDLDFLAKTARAKKLRFSNGEWMLPAVYNGLETPRERPQNDAAWLAWRGTLQGWQKHAPDSITARLAEVAHLIRYAWKARGSGYAGTVTEEGWKLMAERLTEAQKLLRTIPKTCPQWHDNALTIGLGAGWSDSAHQKMFENGWKSFPGYTPFISQRVYFLLPRWNGGPGAWQKWSADFAKKEGVQHYVNALQTAYTYEKEEAFSGIDPTLLHESCAAQVAKRPGSLYQLHRGARMLARAQAPQAAEWMAKLGQTYQSEVWSSYSRIEETRVGLK